VASIYRRKDRNGKPAAKYSIQYKDADDRWRIVIGCADKESTRRLAAKLESDVTLERNGIRTTQTAVPLKKVLRDFQAHLEAKANTDDYIEQSINRLERAFTACKFEKLDDLRTDVAADAFSRFIRDLQTLKGPKGKARPASQQTKNHYLTVMKTFCHWALATGKIPNCRLLFLKRGKVTDAVQRRAATKAELAKIIKVAEQGGEVCDLTGAERAMLYRVATGTGFRAGELADLHAHHFRLTAKPPFILLPSRSAKNREETPQPITDALAKLMRTYLRGVDGPVWPGGWSETAAEMLRVDLASAGIPFETHEGVMDFHALRTSFITNLARAGVHPRIAQQLARHSDINLTMQVYTKMGLDELAEALNGT
jgi:integrase